MFSIACPGRPDGSSRSPVGAPRGCGWITSGMGVREEAGLQDVRLHDTRHSYASMALLCGESVRTVGRLLGHEEACHHPENTPTCPTPRSARQSRPLSPVLSGRQA